MPENMGSEGTMTKAWNGSGTYPPNDSPSPIHYTYLRFVAVVVNLSKQMRDGVILGGRRGERGNCAIFGRTHPPLSVGWEVRGTAPAYYSGGAGQRKMRQQH